MCRIVLSDKYYVPRMDKYEEINYYNITYICNNIWI